MVKGRSWHTLRMAFAFFVISVEQLSINVAGDSAKILSVLGNMGVFSMTVASDLCRGGGALLKIPPILGVQKSFSKKSRACTPGIRI